MKDRYDKNHPNVKPLESLKSVIKRGWKICVLCKVKKELCDFNTFQDESSYVGYRFYSYCTECNKAQCKKYGSENKEKRNRRLRLWRWANPDKAKDLDRRRHVSRYGLTVSDVDEMKSRQKGRCLLCLRDTDLVIDHCHATGRVRGLLCGYCNTVLGWIERDKEFLTRLTAYLSAQGVSNAGPNRNEINSSAKKRP